MRILKVNAQVAAMISVFEIFVNITAFVLTMISNGVTLFTLSLNIGAYNVILPYVFIMNTSHNKYRIVESGWKNVIFNIIGVNNKVTPKGESNQAVDNKVSIDKVKIHDDSGISPEMNRHKPKVQIRRNTTKQKHFHKKSHVNSNVTWEPYQIPPSIDTSANTAHKQVLNDNETIKGVILNPETLSWNSDTEMSDCRNGRKLSKMLIGSLLKCTEDNEERYIDFFKRVVFIEDINDKGKVVSEADLEYEFLPSSDHTIYHETDIQKDNHRISAISLRNQTEGNPKREKQKYNNDMNNPSWEQSRANTIKEENLSPKLMMRREI